MKNRPKSTAERGPFWAGLAIVWLLLGVDSVIAEVVVAGAEYEVTLGLRNPGKEETVEWVALRLDSAPPWVLQASVSADGQGALPPGAERTFKVRFYIDDNTEQGALGDVLLQLDAPEDTFLDRREVRFQLEVEGSSEPRESEVAEGAQGTDDGGDARGGEPGLPSASPAALAAGAANDARVVAGAATGACEQARGELASASGDALERRVSEAQIRLAALSRRADRLGALLQQAQGGASEADRAARELAELDARAVALRDVTCSAADAIAGAATRGEQNRLLQGVRIGLAEARSLASRVPGLLGRAGTGAGEATRANEEVAALLAELAEVEALVTGLWPALSEALAAVDRARSTLAGAGGAAVGLADAAARADAAVALAAASGSEASLAAARLFQDQVASAVEAARRCNESTRLEIDRAAERLGEFESRIGGLRDELAIARVRLSGSELGAIVRAASEAESNRDFAERFAGSVLSRADDLTSCAQAAESNALVEPPGAEPPNSGWGGTVEDRTPQEGRSAEPPGGEPSNSGWGGTVEDRTPEGRGSSSTPQRRPCDIPLEQFQLALKRADLAIVAGNLDRWFDAIVPLAKAGCSGPPIDERIGQAGRMEADANRRRDQQVADATARSRSRLQRPGARSSGGLDLGALIEGISQILYGDAGRGTGSNLPGGSPPAGGSAGGGQGGGAGGSSGSGSGCCCPAGWLPRDSLTLCLYDSEGAADLQLSCVRLDANDNVVEERPVGRRQGGECRFTR